MKTKHIGVFSLMAFVLTLIWLVLLIADMAQAGPMNTFAKVLEHLSTPNPILVISYINVAVLTVAAAMLFGLLYQYCRFYAEEWSVAAAVFVPVYAGLNLIVYLSQITVVPQLVELYRTGDSVAPGVLRQCIQLWPESAAAFANVLAYAVLGIPSMVYGIVLMRHAGSLRWAGGFLSTSGLASIIGLSGLVARVLPLTMATSVSGVLFLAALAFLSYGFLAGQDEVQFME